MKLAIFATHPIQYQVPWFTRLSAEPELDVMVYYAMQPTPEQQGTGFDARFEWDVPLLEGYAWTVLPNAARHPDLSTFWGTRVHGLNPALTSFQPDVAIVTGWQAFSLWQATMALGLHRVPAVMRGESSSVKPRGPVKRAVHKFIVSRFNGFLAIGRRNREFYETLGVDHDRIFECPYFVDNRRFAAQAERFQSERAALRAQWGIPSDRFCFLFAGKLIPKKRIFDALDALSRLARNRDDVWMLIVGSGPEQAALQAYAQKHRLPVSFAGFLNQSEIPGAYAVSDCLVLPSDWDETWGLVVNEAMACGLPAIVSDRVGCAPDLVPNGATGWQYPFGDTVALAQCMADAAVTPENTRRMGAAAKSRVLHEYSVEKAVSGTLDAIHSVSRH